MKNITPYKRIDLLSNLSENFDRLMSSFEHFPEFQSSALATTDWTPKIDVKEKEDKYMVYADVPGIDPANIEVSVENGMLTIKGQRETEKKQENENYLRIERSTGSFIRQMTLPESVDASKVKAKEKHGVLEIILPKSQKGHSHKIPISTEH